MKTLGVQRDPLGERRGQSEGGTASRSTSSCPISSSIARAGASAPSSGEASSCTSASRTRSAATLAKVAGDAGEKVGATVHRGGTYVCMEGPQFSTLAESRLYRSWGADIIGMTNLQEAKLAREAEICYTHDRAGHRLRLLAPRPRRGDRGHGDRDAAPEREDRAAAHRRSRAAGARDTHLRLRHRAQVRHHHAARGDSGRREAANSSRSSANTCK